MNRDFRLAHPQLFEEAGTATGTDATGATLQTPVVLRQADWLFDFPASRWTVTDPS